MRPFMEQRGNPRLQTTLDYGGWPWARGGTITTSDQWLCPDLLDHWRIGAADNLRGRVVRAFFWLMRAWPVRR